MEVALCRSPPCLAHRSPLLNRKSPPFNTTISCSYSTHSSLKFKRQYTSVMIVLMGIGAAIGGFTGDALPVARAVSNVVDCLITHPNVLNAAMLYWPLPNTLYVEGYALNCFAEALWALQPVHQNRVGLVLDAGMEKELQIRHLQVADAARASRRLNVVEYIVTDTPLRVGKWIDPESRQSTGRIKHPDSLLRAVDTLVNKSQVNAIAVVESFPDNDIQEVDDYHQGMGIDNFAGVETVISHVVVKSFQIPCAHAPALSPFPHSPSLCPKSVTEEPLIITVEENETVLNDTPNKIGFEAVSNYWKAIGVISAHKLGVDLFSLRRDQISNIRCKSVPVNGSSLSR